MNSLPKFEKGVSLVCWAYNEELLVEEFLTRAIRLLEAAVEDYEIVIVDDGSTDRTCAIIETVAQDNNRIRLLRNESNKNVAYSAKRAFHAARKEYLFWQTIDWSYDMDHLRLLLELLKSHDIVAGTRREPVQVPIRLLKPVMGVLELFGIKHLTKRSDTVWKAIISVLNYSLVRLLFNFPVSDYQNVVFYPTRLIQSVRREANSSFAAPEILLKLHWRGHSIVEVPISFCPRKAGAAKGTRLPSILAAVRDIFRCWFKWMVLGRCERTRRGTITRYKAEDWDI